MLCVTVIGIPFGVAAFKIASFTAFPFGRELVDARHQGKRRTLGSGIANVLSVLLAGHWLAIIHAAQDLLAFVTIIGIRWAVALHEVVVQVLAAVLDGCEQADVDAHQALGVEGVAFAPGAVDQAELPGVGHDDVVA